MKIINQYRGLRREIYVLFVCKFIDKAGSMIGPMLTLILSSKLGMNASAIATYFLIYTLLSLPLYLLGGKLTDKINKRLYINVCDITSGIIFIICGIVGLNRTTLIVYMLGSLLQELESPAYDTMIADFTNSADRDRAYSLIYLGYNLGFILTPALSGFLIGRHLGLMFVLSGTFQLLSLLVFDIYVKNVDAVRDEVNVYETSGSADVSAFSVLKESRVLIPFLIILALSMLVYSMFGYLMPLSLTEVHGDIGSVLYGTMSSVNGVTVLLCTAALTAFFSKRCSIDKMIAGNLFELAGLLLFFLLLGRPMFYYLSIFVFTLGEILNTVTTRPYLTRRIPISCRGRISAVSSVSSDAVVSLGKLGIGAVYDRLGSGAAWSVVFLTSVLTIIGYVILKKKDKEVYSGLYVQSEG